MYVHFTVPPPPVANAKVRERVSRASGFRGFVSAFFCCLCPRVARKAVSLDATRKLVDLERDNEDAMLWRVHRVQAASKLTSAALQMLVWLSILAGLIFLFIAQFSWFPWPDDRPENDPKRTLIGGKPPARFFRECAPVNPACDRPFSAGKFAPAPHALNAIPMHTQLHIACKLVYACAMHSLLQSLCLGTRPH
jgi:hypothetical protein